MNWEAIGAIGEIIGALAVITTLIYLAVQVKQTKKGLEANTTAILGASEVSGNENAIQHLATLYSDEQLVEIVMRGVRDLQDLQPQDFVRFNGFCHSGIQLHQVTYLQWKKGLLDDEYWAFCLRYTGEQLLRHPGVQAWWEMNREIYTRDYRLLIDSLIESSGWRDPSKYLDENQHVTIKSGAT